MTITTTPTIKTGVAFSCRLRPLTWFPLLFILIRPANYTAPHREQPKRFGLIPPRHSPLSLLPCHRDNVFSASRDDWRMNPTDEREQCDDSWGKKKEEGQTRPSTEFFLWWQLNKRPTAPQIPPSSGMVARHAGAPSASVLLHRLAAI